MAAIVVEILTIFLIMAVAAVSGQENSISNRLIQVNGGPDSVVWVVQFSDLHFSVHHPERALDFKELVGPFLSIINPSLVLITGDLTGFRRLFLFILVISSFFSRFFSITRFNFDGFCWILVGVKFWGGGVLSFFLKLDELICVFK